jgi:hypothetical protein
MSGLEPGAYDHRMTEWASGWDTPTVLTIASWIARARLNGPPQPPQRSRDQARRVNFQMPEVGQFSDAVDRNESAPDL